jgi:hypothetical protein
VPVQHFQILVRQVFHGDQPVAGALDGGHDFVQLELHGQGVLVLRALDEEHHEERDDRRAGIDHQLPRVRKLEDRTAASPHDDDAQRDQEGRRGACFCRDPTRKTRQTLRQTTMLRALLLTH